MIEFKIQGKEYTVKEPTIRDYYDLQTLLIRKDIDSKVEIVSRLSGCPSAHLKLLDSDQFVILWNELITNHFEVRDDTPFYRSFMFKNQLYGFLNMDNLTIGEFADMDTMRMDPNYQGNLHTMMAVLYRPAIMITDTWMKIDDYDVEAVKRRAEEFLDLPLKYVYSALNFFFQVSRYLLESIGDFLAKDKTLNQNEKEMLRMLSQVTSLTLETGTTSSSSLLERMQPKLEKLRTLAQSMPSTTSPTERTNQGRLRKLSAKLYQTLKIGSK